LDEAGKIAHRLMFIISPCSSRDISPPTVDFRILTIVSYLVKFKGSQQQHRSEPVRSPQIQLSLDGIWYHIVTGDACDVSCGPKTLQETKTTKPHHIRTFIVSPGYTLSRVMI